jgi:hypothetical protein
VELSTENKELLCLRLRRGRNKKWRKFVICACYFRAPKRFMVPRFCYGENGTHKYDYTFGREQNGKRLVEGQRIEWEESTEIDFNKNSM